jgi:hypothetical protein
MSQEAVEPDDQPPSPEPVAQADVQVKSEEPMVGPTPEELESFNELIQFITSILNLRLLLLISRLRRTSASSSPL